MRDSHIARHAGSLRPDYYDTSCIIRCAAKIATANGSNRTWSQKRKRACARYELAAFSLSAGITWLANLSMEPK